MSRNGSQVFVLVGPLASRIAASLPQSAVLSGHRHGEQAAATTILIEDRPATAAAQVARNILQNLTAALQLRPAGGLFANETALSSITQSQLNNIMMNEANTASTTQDIPTTTTTGSFQAAATALASTAASMAAEATTTTTAAGGGPHSLTGTLSKLSAWELLLVILLIGLIVVSIVGNCLVCIAIFTDRRLRKLGNAFIVSLAIADLFVSCLVMTFALANDLMDYWMFGAWFCDIWISFDIMCCTASILNLCAISLDRFIHIKDCLLYNQLMTRRVAISAVIGIWIISALVSFVPINLGWHKPNHFKFKFKSPLAGAGRLVGTAMGPPQATTLPPSLLMSSDSDGGVNDNLMTFAQRHGSNNNNNNENNDDGGQRRLARSRRQATQFPQQVAWLGQADARQRLRRPPALGTTSEKRFWADNQLAGRHSSETKAPLPAPQQRRQQQFIAQLQLEQNHKRPLWNEGAAAARNQSTRTQDNEGALTGPPVGGGLHRHVHGHFVNKRDFVAQPAPADQGRRGRPSSGLNNGDATNGRHNAIVDGRHRRRQAQVDLPSAAAAAAASDLSRRLRTSKALNYNSNGASPVERPASARGSGRAGDESDDDDADDDDDQVESNPQDGTNGGRGGETKSSSSRSGANVAQTKSDVAAAAAKLVAGGALLDHADEPTPATGQHRNSMGPLRRPKRSEPAAFAASFNGPSGTSSSSSSSSTGTGNLPQCMLTLTPTYAIISSTISFYIPCLIMLGLYSKLFACARRHVRNIRAITRAPHPIGGGGGGGATANCTTPSLVANQRRQQQQRQPLAASNGEQRQQSNSSPGSQAAARKLLASDGSGGGHGGDGSNPTSRPRPPLACRARTWLKFGRARRPGPPSGASDALPVAQSLASHQNRHHQRAPNDCGKPALSAASCSPLPSAIPAASAAAAVAAAVNDKAQKLSRPNETIDHADGADAAEREPFLAEKLAEGRQLKTNELASGRDANNNNNNNNDIRDNANDLKSNSFLAGAAAAAAAAAVETPQSGLDGAGQANERKFVTNFNANTAELNPTPGGGGGGGGQPLQPPMAASAPNLGNQIQQQQQQNKQQTSQLATHKAAITLGIIMGTFLFCWVPFFCLNIIKAFYVDSIPAPMFRAFTWLGYANSALNPIIYGIHNSEFRNAFNRIFFKHLTLKNGRQYLNRRFSYDLRPHNHHHNHNNHGNHNHNHHQRQPQLNQHQTQHHLHQHVSQQVQRQPQKQPQQLNCVDNSAAQLRRLGDTGNAAKLGANQPLTQGQLGANKRLAGGQSAREVSENALQMLAADEVQALASQAAAAAAPLSSCDEPSSKGHFYAQQTMSTPPRSLTTVHRTSQETS